MFLTLTESLLSYERKYLVQAGWPCTLYKASKDQTSVNVLKTFSFTELTKGHLNQFTVTLSRCHNKFLHRYLPVVTR